jgi:hypothetical protein
MGKVSQKIMEFFEKELNNEESRSRIQENILAPSLSLLKEEIDKSGTNTYVTSMVQHLLWPAICIMLMTMMLCILIASLQIYIIVR